MVDQPKLDQMLANPRGYLEALRRMAATPPAEFMGNPDRIGNAKYHFIVAFECAIDIANHIIASENLRFPNDNADSFAALVEAGLLSPDQRGPLAAMARFRNRLVHVYGDVDSARVFEYLQHSLTDLEHFMEKISNHDWNQKGAP